MNIAELIDSLASWPTLLLAIVVYGFAPGFLLRLIVLVYERDDPRRDELVAEMYAMPRLKRPFWVAEQFETALFDGLLRRIKRTATGRIILHGSLAVMIFSNGYATYWTLAPMINFEFPMVLMFSIALTFGTFFGAYEIGRLARSRREDRAGNLVVISVLAICWLGNGGCLAWMRSTQLLHLQVNEIEKAASLESLQFGLLLLGLHLLTGALAITTGYRFGRSYSEDTAIR